MKTGLFFHKQLFPGIKKIFFLFFILLIFSSKTIASNYYWVGGTGNWSTLNHWATTSGGTTFYTQIPTALDDIFFDAHSFSAPGQTVTFDALTIFVHNFTWTGVTNNPTLAGPATTLLKIYGSLTFVAGMNMNFAGPVQFDATTTGITISMAGKAFNDQVDFSGAGGEWTLQDVFTSTQRLYLNNGILNTNNKTVNIGEFVSPLLSNPAQLRTLNMGSSVFNLSTAFGGWAPVLNGLTLNCGTSTINFTANDASAILAGGGATYYNVNFNGTGTNSLNQIADNNNTFHDVVFASKAKYSTNNFHNVILHGDADISGNCTYNDLTLTAGHSYSIQGFAFFNGVQTINGTLTANGNCGALIDIHGDSPYPGDQGKIAHPAGTVNTSYLVLKDIDVSGGANFIANNSVDLGNNTGWNFNNSGTQNLYWIGNSGNWSDGNHWSYTSGGLPSGCPPTPMNNVFFDANSFSAAGQIVTINVQTAYCNDMKWTGATHTPTLAGPVTNLLKIYGSLAFVSGMNITYLGLVNFEAITPGKTIQTSGQIFHEKVTFNGVNGGWTLQDAFSTSGRILHVNGTITTNNQTVNALEFYSYNPDVPVPLRALNMGASVFNVSGPDACWGLNASGLTLNCGTSHIFCTANATNLYFGGGGLTYYDVSFTSTSGTLGSIDAGNTFHNVVFNSKGQVITDTFHIATFHGDGMLMGNCVYDDLNLQPGHTYQVYSFSSPGGGGIQTINGTLSANGNCNALIDIHATDPGQQGKIAHPPGTVNTSFLILKDIDAGGGATFNTTNSTDLGNNTGWNFGSGGSNGLYWVGNSGNWSDGNHWSLTSGGPPAGCAPTPVTNVFFDGNSFSTAGQSVVINVPTAYCKNMSWTGVTNTPQLSGPNNLLEIYGSLTFVTGMNLSFQGIVYFEATTTGQTIATGGRTFNNRVYFNGVGGGWTLQDNFSTVERLTLNNGILTTNNKTVNALEFVSAASGMPIGPRTLNMGASTFNIYGQIVWAVTDLTVNSGSSVINSLLNNATVYFNGGGNVYHNVNFNGTGTSSVCNVDSRNRFYDVFFASKAQYSTDTFHTATLRGDGYIDGYCVYNDLNFTAGHTYSITSISDPGIPGNQKISHHWQIQGSCTSYIVLQSTTSGSPASIIMNSGQVLAYNIHIKDIACSGGANFIAYNSVDLGGNTGWNFSTLPPLNNPGIISGPSQVCTGSTAVVYHVSPVAGAISYQWTVPAGAVIISGQGDTTITVNFGAAVTGNVVVQSFNGCNAGTISSVLTIVVGTQFTATVSIAADTIGPICHGTAVTFTATALNSGGSTINYDFMINGMSVQNSSSNIFTTSGLSNNDEVSCEITLGATTCFVSTTAMSDTLTISVNTDPAPDPHATIIANPTGEICNGMPVIITSTVTGSGSSSINYDFKINGISVQSSSSNIFTTGVLLNNDVISCEVTLNATTCFASATTVSNNLSITVNSDPLPDTHVTIAASPGGQICAGKPIIITAAVTGAGNNNIDYNFMINGTSVQNGNSNIFTANTLESNDSISCYISVSAGACFASTNAISNIIVLDGKGCDDCTLQIPNAITPNGDGINDKWIISNQDCFRQISVFVYNRYGSLVYQKNNYQNDWQGTYKSQLLPDGTYYYIIKAITREQREQLFKGNLTVLR